jgi:hypothetical protein
MGKKPNAYKVPVGKYEGSWLFGRHRRRWEMNIKMAPKGTDWEHVN